MESEAVAWWMRRRGWEEGEAGCGNGGGCCVIRVRGDCGPMERGEEEIAALSEQLQQVKWRVEHLQLRGCG